MLCYFDLPSYGLGVPSSYLGPSASPAPHPGVSGCPVYGVSTSPPYGVAAAAAGVGALYAPPFADEGVGAAAGVGASYAVRELRRSLGAVLLV